MSRHKYLSEVTVKVSRTEDGKFRGHVIEPDGERTATVANKSRDAAIGHALSDARSVLKLDNVKVSGSSPESRSK